MAGISSRALSFGKDNHYKYNDGNELEEKNFSDGSGLQWYDATFRSYDPQIGRFAQTDPLADINHNSSPYGFASNDPIFLNDFLGLLSDSAHPVQIADIVIMAPARVPKDFEGHLNFPNGGPYSIAKNSVRPVSLSRDRNNDLTDQWFLGFGPINTVFPANHPMTKDMMNAPGIKDARVAFYRKYMQLYKSKKFGNSASLTNYSVSFGLEGVLMAGANLTQQFVGSYDVNIYTSDDAKSLLFVVDDSKSITSAYYHLPFLTNVERDPSAEYSMMGNTYQRYIWSEPVDFNGYGASGWKTDEYLSNPSVQSMMLK